jgi:hypothetical protein
MLAGAPKMNVPINPTPNTPYLAQSFCMTLSLFEANFGGLGLRYFAMNARI